MHCTKCYTKNNKYIKMLPYTEYSNGGHYCPVCGYYEEWEEEEEIDSLYQDEETFKEE